MTDTWYDPMHPQERPAIVARLRMALARSPSVAILVIVVAAFFWWMLRTPAQTEFDPATWRSSDGQTVRWRMHKDLLRSGELEGKTVYEVLELLGPPTEYRDTDGRRLEYNMGIEQETFFKVDGVWLCLYFGADGMFQRHQVATD
jgi:hypothetical protein